MASQIGALKKPQTAYFLWFNAKREEIQTKVGSKDFKIVGAKGSELWKAASETEKRPFEKEAQRQRDAFEKFKATPEGQKALEQKKADKSEEKKALQEKRDEKHKIAEEKQVAREMRAAKAAVKAVEKDDALKKPLSAYFAWLNDNRSSITASLGGKGGPEVTKKGSEMWKALSEKARKPYEDKYIKEKEAYDAYLQSEEGAAALKAYKEATSAVAYKKPVEEPSEAAEEAEQVKPRKAAKRKAEEQSADTTTEPSPDKKTNIKGKSQVSSGKAKGMLMAKAGA